MSDEEEAAAQLRGHAERIESEVWRYQMVIRRYRYDFPALADLATRERDRLLALAASYRRAAEITNPTTTEETP